jgi:hypothetical protein
MARERRRALAAERANWTDGQLLDWLSGLPDPFK